MRLSDKQQRVATFGQRDGQYLICDGPRQVGKSEAVHAGFLQWAGRAFQGYDFPLIARSQRQMDALVARLQRMLQEGFGPDITMERAPGRKNVWQIPSYHGPPNYFMEVVSSDGLVAAAERVQGLPLGGALVEELTRINVGLLNMVIGGMVTEWDKAKLWGSCNPEGPSHPIKTDWIDLIESGELEGERYQFGRADHPTADQDAYDQLAKQYSGSYYRRMILGEWASSDGLVFPTFERTFEPPPKDELPRYFDVAIDWGRSSITTALLTAAYSDRFHVVAEWTHDGKQQGVMESADQADAITEWALGHAGSVSSWVVPWDAHGIAERWGKTVQGQVVLAYDRNDEGINFTNLYLEGSGGRPHVTIDKSRCPHLCRDLDLLPWKESAEERGVYVMDKAAAFGGHYSDAFRYQFATLEAHNRGLDWSREMA